MIGVKTGYTSKAGPCLIARAKEGKKENDGGWERERRYSAGDFCQNIKKVRL